MNKKALLSEQPVLSCKNLSKSFVLPGIKPVKKISVIKRVNLKLFAGERVAITGASGAGKTTLLSILGGLEQADSGDVCIGKTHLHGMSANQLARLRNGMIGFVYQFHHLLMEFTALENVAIPLLLRNMNVSLAEAKAKKTLKMVGLGKRQDHKPAELSGGERQRVAVARAIVGDPVCVMLDEPSGNLDDTTAESLHKFLIDISNETGTAMLTVTHDTRLAALMKRRYVLKTGKLTQVA